MADSQPGQTTTGAIALLLVTATLPALNSSSLNVALVDLVNDLGATTADLQWVLNAYTLAYTGLVLCVANVSDRLGRRRTLLIGLAGLLVTSAIGAFATSPSVVIGIRALMGVSAAMLHPMTLALLVDLTPDPARRSRVVSSWAAVSSVGLALGPIVGGFLLEHAWWGSVFLMNVPVTACLIVGTVAWLPVGESSSPPRWDPIGMILSIAGFTAIVWAVIQAPNVGWVSPPVIAVLGAGLLLVIGFVLWERHPAHELLDLSCLRDVEGRVALAALAALTFVFGGVLLVAGIVMRSVLALSPFSTGLALVPLAAAMAAGSAASLRLAARTGVNRTVSIGCALLVLATLALSSLTPDSGYPTMAFAITCVGAGFGLASAPITSTVLAVLPADRANLASAVNLLTRQGANALGVAVSGSIVSATYQSDLAVSGRVLAMPATALRESQESIAAALGLAKRLGGADGKHLADAAVDAFAHGVRRSGAACAVLVLFAAVAAWRWLPSDRR